MKQRILMQEADASPGSGAPAPAPTEAPAQGAAPAPAIDVNAIVTQVRDSMFAELRRSGVLGKEKPKAKTSDEPPTPVNYRALDRAVARHPHAQKLNDAAYTRLERAYAAESPEDAGQWLKDYFEGMGVAETSPPAPAKPAEPQRSAVPLNGGTPPVPTPDLENAPILSMSEADRQHLLKTKGAKWYMEQFAKQTKGLSIRLR